MTQVSSQLLRTPINVVELFEKIEVLPPYFALENLEIDTDKNVFATIPVEQEMGNEVGLLSGAEVGRHLAILGSCAIAYLNESPGRHFYLACEATIKMIDEKPLQYTSERSELPKIFGKAKGQFVNRKTAKAECAILNADGDVLYVLDVTYKVVREEVFLRINSQNAVKQDYGLINPYIIPLDLKNQKFENNVFSASIGKVESQWCLGHFNEIPALPVAHLMYNLSSCISKNLSFVKLQETVQYYLHKTTIWAEDLAFTGEIVDFQSTLIETIEDKYHFICSAITSENKVVGRLDSWMTVVE